MSTAKASQPAEAAAKLAIHGGPKAVPAIEGQPRPKVGAEEFLALARRFGFKPEAVERIRSAISDDDIQPGWSLARWYGPKETSGDAFEAAGRELFGVRYARAVSNGTGALHSAMAAVGVGPGAEVIVPAIGFYATAASVVAAQGVPIFCDVDTSLHMDPAKLERLITPRTVAVAATHAMGGVADLGPIVEIAHGHGLKVIEDCAQAPGARYRGKWVGTVGDMGCFSISAYKIIGGGEGGMFITDDERLFERACQLAECGGLWRPDRFAPPRYEGELFNGTNYRLSELESAINVVQLGKLAEVVRRHHAAKTAVLGRLKRYREIAPQKLNDPDGEVGYLLRFIPESHELGRKIVEALRAEGIGADTRGPQAKPDWHLGPDTYPITSKSGATKVSCPFQCPVYRERGGAVEYRRGDCPVAEDLFNRVVNVGINQWWTEADCRNVAEGLNKVFSAYCTEDAAAPAWM